MRPILRGADPARKICDGEEVQKLMEAFGAVLRKHLDEEVQTLRADNMRKYWSLDEMRRLPMGFILSLSSDFIPRALYLATN